jgi:hypothetical protein
MEEVDYVEATTTCGILAGAPLPLRTAQVRRLQRQSARCLPGAGRRSGGGRQRRRIRAEAGAVLNEQGAARSAGSTSLGSSDIAGMPSAEGRHLFLEFWRPKIRNSLLIRFLNDLLSSSI